MDGKLSIEEFREWLEKRTPAFSIATFKFLNELPKDNASRVSAYQLGKSASSIGANYREANRAESREDFAHKLAIALKEANESAYWFEVLSGLYEGSTELEILAKETGELRSLLQCIVTSVKQSAKTQNSQLKTHN